MHQSWLNAIPSARDDFFLQDESELDWKREWFLGVSFWVPPPPFLGGRGIRQVEERGVFFE
jgi:hypothetical protein